MAINLSPEMNPARQSSFAHAQERAKREEKPMRVYVAGPDAVERVTSNDGKNVWYVRPYDEAAPVGAELFREITPFGCNIRTEECIRDRARDHVAYGWAKNPGSHSGTAWSDAERAVYNEEFDRLTAANRK